MDNFGEVVEIILNEEGGISKRPLSEDPGGLTNHGISKRFLQSIGDSRNVQDLTRSDIIQLYRQYFWNKIKGDHLPQPLATVVFDHAVNAGPYSASKLLQLLLNEYGAHLIVDEKIGPRTIKAIQEINIDPKILAQKYLWCRLHFYANVMSRHLREANLSGWCNRLCALERRFSCVPH